MRAPGELVAGAVAGAGAGADGPGTGAVERLGGTGEVGTRAVTLDAGALGDTGAVALRGLGTPVPGLARRVMRTVSFFKGTVGEAACGLGAPGAAGGDGGVGPWDGCGGLGAS